MSFMARADLLDSRTRRDIEQGAFKCGCEARTPRWFICSYHEGFDEALDRHAPSVTDKEET